jgi:16S rRNA (guanine527-N7)-methyltransferase
MITKENFIARLNAGIPEIESFGERYGEKFFRYFELLIEYNEKMNLTAITDPDEVIKKHFSDSLLPHILGLIPTGTTVADVGSGAGFPGIPLAIVLPECEFLLMESIGKRVDFLNTVIEELGLTNCRAEKIRAEEAGAKGSTYRESFDFATARAVSRLSILSEYCLPLVKQGGRMLALKSAAAPSEIEEAANAISTLGGTNAKIVGTEERNVVVVEKSAPTPDKYPRRTGVPEKRPL